MSRAWKSLIRVMGTVLAGGLLSATLVRYAPGYELDEEQMDVRRSAESRRRLMEERAGERDVVGYYARYLGGYVKGDWGNSRLLKRPVRELMGERAGLTGKVVLSGLGLAWVVALGALALGGRRRWVLEAAEGGGVVLQCLPAAVVALMLALGGARGWWLGGVALAAVVYPRLMRTLRAVWAESLEAPHVGMARARGIGAWGLLWRHVWRPARGRVAALAGVSVSMALGAAIPVETVLDLAGVGQLAWQAALGRDLNLLLSVTVAMMVIVSAANALAERWEPEV